MFALSGRPMAAGGSGKTRIAPSLYRIVLCVAFGLVAVGGNAFAQAVDLSDLPAHPRLFLTPARIAEMKQEATVAPKNTMFQELKRRADTYKAEGPTTQYFKILVMTVVGHVYNDNSYITRAVENFNAAMDDGYWVPESIEPTLAYDWLYPYMTQTDRNRARAVGLEYISLGGQRTVYYNLEANEATYKGLRGIALYGDGNATENQLCQAAVDEWDGRMRGVREYRFPDGSATSKGGVIPTRQYYFADGGYYKGNHYAQKDMEGVITYLAVFKELGLGDYFGMATTYLANWPEYMIYMRRPDYTSQRLMSGLTTGLELRGKYSLCLIAHYLNNGVANWMMHHEDWSTGTSGSNNWAIPSVMWRPGGALTDVSTLPLYKFWGGQGDTHVAGTSYAEKVVVRSGWDFSSGSDDVYFTLHAGDYFGDYYNYYQLAFELYYRGALAHRAGTYGPEDHGFHYYSRAVSTNSVVVIDPSQSQLGDKWGTDWTYDDPGRPEHIYDVEDDTPYNAADITAFEASTSPSGEPYYYVKAQLNPDNAYYYSNDTRKVRRMEREAVLHGQYLIVRDHIELGGTLHSVRWLLHTIEEPAIQNPVVVSTTVPNHITTYQRTSYSATRLWDDYDGKVTCVPLLPANATVRKVGGTGYECWVDNGNGTGENFPVAENLYEGEEEAGRWRVETIAPASPVVDFVHALYVSRPNQSMASTVTIDTSTAVGCEVDGVGAYLFARDAGRSGINYELQGTLLIPNFLNGLEPGMAFEVTTSTKSEFLTASDEGTLSFEAAGPTHVEVRQAPVAGR